jgi:hypothetical protein
MSDAWGDPIPPEHGEPGNVTDPIDDSFLWAVVRTGDLPLIEDALRATRRQQEEEDPDGRC